MVEKLETERTKAILLFETLLIGMLLQHPELLHKHPTRPPPGGFFLLPFSVIPSTFLFRIFHLLKLYTYTRGNAFYLPSFRVN